MPPTLSSSSVPAPEAAGTLRAIPLAALRAHPANANRMAADRRAKLAANIVLQEGRYPPLIVRPHPTERDAFQVLDGHQRWAVLAELGHARATCYCWPCDDATALRLLATLNRLEGADVPVQRAALLQELQTLLPAADLATLLPEDAEAIADTIALLAIDTDALEADLARARSAAQPQEAVFTFVVPLGAAAAVEAALSVAGAGLTGPNRRGRAFLRLCQGDPDAPGEPADA